MESRILIWVFLAWAIAGAPVLFGIYVFWSYCYALSYDGLPFSILPEWLWFLVFSSCIASGIAAVNFLPFRRLWLRIAINVIYILGIVVTLLFVHLMVACANGDCL